MRPKRKLFKKGKGKGKIEEWGVRSGEGRQGRAEGAEETGECSERPDKLH